MNEQIEQLMVDASGGSCYDGPTGAQLSGDQIEKFARLVVQECCKTIERTYKYSNGTPVSFWEMSQDVQDLLNKQFEN